MEKSLQQAASNSQHSVANTLDQLAWDDLRMLAVTSRHRSFRQAARALGVNASTILRHVDRLEEALGTKLYNSSADGFDLTVEGERISKVAIEMARTLKKIADDMNADNALKGTVKIVIEDVIGDFWLAPNISAIVQNYPEICIDIECLNNEIAEKDSDIFISTQKSARLDDISYRLCYVHLYPFASLRYIEKYGIPRSRMQLADHRMVSLRGENREKAENSNSSLLSRAKVESAIKTNSTISMLHAIEMGLGIGMLPTFAMSQATNLIPIDIGGEEPLEIWISFKKERRDIQRISVVLEWIRHVFDPKKHPWFAKKFIHPTELNSFISNNDVNPFFPEESILSNIFNK